MTRDIALYLSDILENMDDAAEFVRGMSYEAFINDKKTNRAVIRCIEIVGEATKNVTDEIRTLSPSIPWREMTGMRDKCIHMYFGVNYETVWLTVTKRIPAIRPLIEELLKNIRGQKK